MEIRGKVFWGKILLLQLPPLFSWKELCSSFEENQKKEEKNLSEKKEVKESCFAIRKRMEKSESGTTKRLSYKSVNEPFYNGSDRTSPCCKLSSPNRNRTKTRPFGKKCFCVMYFVSGVMFQKTGFDKTIEHEVREENSLCSKHRGENTRRK